MQSLLQKYELLVTFWKSGESGQDAPQACSLWLSRLSPSILVLSLCGSIEHLNTAQEEGNMVSLGQVRKGETGDIQRPKIKAVWNIRSEFLCPFPFSPFSKPSSSISILLSIYYVPGTMLGTVGTVKNGEEGNP